jgi:hypothetical protein
VSDELDICPFCGAQPLLNEIAPHSHNLTIGGVKFPDHPGSWTIECPACECGMIADTRGAVTAAWNRRAQPAEEAQPVADEQMEYRVWFNTTQGQAYDSMWHFGKAAWMARAKRCQPTEEGAKS